MKLPNAEQALVDLAKLRDYALDPVHQEANTKPACSLPRSDFPETMPSGCAINFC